LVADDYFDEVLFRYLVMELHPMRTGEMSLSQLLPADVVAAAC
jgi:hypothetical protein